MKFSPERIEKERAKFEAMCASKHMDASKRVNQWTKQLEYDASHVDAMWYGWLAAIEAQEITLPSDSELDSWIGYEMDYYMLKVKLISFLGEAGFKVVTK